MLNLTSRRLAHGPVGTGSQRSLFRVSPLVAPCAAHAPQTQLVLQHPIVVLANPTHLHMSIPPRKRIFGNVNLGYYDPVEALDPDQLKRFSKEELSAYLLYYGSCE